MNELTPYLEILYTQIGPATGASDANSRLVPEYSRRLLNLLVQRERALPVLQDRAAERLGGLLEELTAELQAIEGGLILVPQLLRTLRTERNYAQAETVIQNAVRLLGVRMTPQARRLEARIARIGLDLMESFTEAVSAHELTSSSIAAGEGLDAEKKVALRTWLRQRFSDDDVELGKIETVIGGGSKRTLIVALHGARRLPSEIVVRIDHAAGVVESAVVDEYALIEAVHRVGVRAPQPLGIERDRQALGAPFIVVSRVPGHNIGDWIDVREPSRAFALGLAETLARLHGMPVEDGGDHLPGARTSIRERVVHELDFYERSWRASGESSILLEQGLAWARRHLDQSEGRRAVIHGDVGCHNMLGHAGDLSALLDWETAVIGHPAQDLMYAKHTVEQMMPWDEFLGAYEAAGGTLPSTEQIEFYGVLTPIFRLHYMILARAFVAGGISNSLVHAYAGNRVSLHSERQLCTALANALDREAAGSA